MNCLEFQNLLNSDPRHLPTLARQHAENCADCARRMVKQLNLDASIVDSLQIATPDGMEDRILLATKLGDKKRLTFYVMAASIMLAIAVTFSLPFYEDKTELDMAIEHVLAEPQHLLETHNVSSALLNALLARVGAHSEALLPVSYANACTMPNGEGGHIVLNTQYGRVTLLLMPDGASGSVQRKETKGLIAEIYAARYGNYSLIAGNNAALSAAKSLLDSHLIWT